MNKISCEELKKKIDDKDDFKLVFCLEEHRFRANHIPGSICIPITSEIPITPESIQNKPALKENIMQLLGMDDEIVVYCSDVSCVASIRLYQRLEHFGFKNISRFPGGLRKWEENGNTFVGEKVI